MRRFRVGDRVRFETDKTGDWPRWDYSLDCGGDGGFLSGTVTDEDDLCLTVEWNKMERWEWPQPGEPDSEYGAPGYLELVEAVEDQGSNPKWVEEDVDSHQRGYDAGYENGLHDGKIIALREQGPTKTVTVDQVENTIYDYLTDNMRPLAEIVAEALVGKTVVKK